MVEKSGFMKKGECINCGAPLKRANQKGEYICGHCGTVYFDERLSGDPWKEERQVKTLPKIEPEPSPTTSIYPDTSVRTVAIIAIAVVVIICLFIVVVNSLSRTGRTSRSEAKPSERNSAPEKPQMLTTLPKAVKAGTPIAYKNWEIQVEPELSVSSNQLFFRFSVKSWHEDNQVLRFEPKTFIVYDNLGKVYPLRLGSCAPDLPYLSRQVNFVPYEIVSFQSNSSWCNRGSYIPTYSGVIGQNVTHIYLHLEDFGVFKTITFVFDL